MGLKVSIYIELTVWFEGVWYNIILKSYTIHFTLGNSFR